MVPERVHLREAALVRNVHRELKESRKFPAPKGREIFLLLSGYRRKIPKTKSGLTLKIQYAKIQMFIGGLVIAMTGRAVYGHSREDVGCARLLRNNRAFFILFSLVKKGGSTIYFQAMMQPKAAFIVTVGRGFVISGLLIFLLSAIAGADSIWYAMLITEG